MLKKILIYLKKYIALYQKKIKSIYNLSFRLYKDHYFNFVSNIVP